MPEETLLKFTMRHMAELPVLFPRGPMYRILPVLDGPERLVDRLNRRYELANFFVPVRIEFRDHGPVLLLHIALPVLERDSAIPMPLDGWFSIKADIPMEEIDRFVLDHLGTLLLHEAAECFLVDGERKFDPHRQKESPR